MAENIAFFVPTQKGEFELVEKKSRFLGEVWAVENEGEANARLEETRKKYHDATHHCWCFRIDPLLLRCSDDGEPQGTAGQPMLGVFTQEKVQEVCCVVTRYFGNTELGVGGLKRAYGHCAKGALESAGFSYYDILTEFSLQVPYPLFETVQHLMVQENAVLTKADYGVDVVVTAHVSKEKAPQFLEILRESTSAQVPVTEVGEVAQRVPLVKQ